jgi:hypothetical protein
VPPPHALALSIDRPKAVRARHALAKAMLPILKKAAIDVAAQIERSIEKAERDPGEMSGDRGIARSVRAARPGRPLAAELEEIGHGCRPDRARERRRRCGSDLVNQVNAGRRLCARARRGSRQRRWRREPDRQHARDDPLASSPAGLKRISAATPSRIRSRKRRLLRISRQSDRRQRDRGSEQLRQGESWNAVKADGALMVKQWFVSGEDGVCEICEANEAQGEIAFDEQFDSGDDMEPAHVGCRCVTTARVLDAGEAADDEGADDAEG